LRLAGKQLRFARLVGIAVMSRAWMSGAVCAQIDPDLWFAEEGNYHASIEAKRICQTCPVLAECGEYAIKGNILYGIWGGMTLRERQAVKRRSRK